MKHFMPGFKTSYPGANPTTFLIYDYASVVVVVVEFGLGK
jgi:hypothetical protein